MTALIKNFAKSESGAVSVDWVVLTAALVGLGIAVIGMVSWGVEDVSQDITNSMVAQPVNNSFFGGGLGFQQQP